MLTCWDGEPKIDEGVAGDGARQEKIGWVNPLTSSLIQPLKFAVGWEMTGDNNFVARTYEFPPIFHPYHYNCPDTVYCTRHAHVLRPFSAPSLSSSDSLQSLKCGGPLAPQPKSMRGFINRLRCYLECIGTHPIAVSPKVNIEKLVHKNVRLHREIVGLQLY